MLNSIYGYIFRIISIVIGVKCFGFNRQNIKKRILFALRYLIQYQNFNMRWEKEESIRRKCFTALQEPLPASV